MTDLLALAAQLALVALMAMAGGFGLVLGLYLGVAAIGGITINVKNNGAKQ